VTDLSGSTLWHPEHGTQISFGFGPPRGPKPKKDIYEMNPVRLPTISNPLRIKSRCSRVWVAM
jgi:hypothetical protein